MNVPFSQPNLANYIQEGSDAVVSQITFPDGSTQTAAAVPASQVTGLTYNAENDDKLVLTQSAGPNKEVTIPSGGLPFAFAQTDDTEIIDDLAYSKTDGTHAGAQITQLSQTITPTSSSQKVAIHLTLFGEWQSYPYECAVILERKIGSAASTLIQPDNAGSRMAIGAGWAITLDFADQYGTPELLNLVYVDSPDTTDTITYTPRVVARTDRDFYLNRSLNDGGSGGGSDSFERSFSTMTLECKNV